MAEAQLERFIAEFEASASFVGIDRSLIDGAKLALIELYAPYEITAAYSFTSAPWYAVHGENHGVRLAGVARSILQSQIRSEAETPEIRDIRTLVLAFASFLFHDIGMCIPPECTSLDEMARTQNTRLNHDERSLEFLEKTFIDRSDEFPAWNGFWKSVSNTGDWPNPVGRFAFIVLCRVCKSHGDDPSIWLSDASLETYEFRTRSEVIYFPHHWHNKWPNTRNHLSAAATLLNICDLCDLGPSRYPALPDTWTTLALPAKVSDRRTSLVHFMSHQVSRVEFAQNALIVNVSGSSEYDWAYHAALYGGAVSDLLYWGNHEKLVARIRQFVNPMYEGVIVDRSVNRDEEWSSIATVIRSSEFSDCWDSDNINRHLLPLTMSVEDRLFLSVVYHGLARMIASNLSENRMLDEFNSYQAYLATLSAGVVIDALCALPDLPDGCLAYDVSIGDGFSGSEARLTRFAQALAVTRIRLGKANRALRIRHVLHGTRAFSALLRGNLSEFDRSVILCEVRDRRPGDDVDYRTILERVLAEGSERSIVIIFIGYGYLDQFNATLDNVYLVRAVTDSYKIAVIRSFSNNKIVIDNDPEVVLEFNENEDLVHSSDDSVGALVKELWQRSLGASISLAAIRLNLSDAGRSYARSIGALAILTLIDCGGIRKDRADPTLICSLSNLETNYEQIRHKFDAASLCTWDDAFSALPVDLIDSETGIVSVRPSMLEDFDEFGLAVAGGAGWFRCAIGAAFLQLGGFFNPASKILRGNSVTRDHVRVILDQISEDELYEHVRVQIGVALGDFLGEQICRDSVGFVWLAGIFPSGSLTASLASCIRFQIAYRVARQCIENSALGVVPEHISSFEMSLGLLEALCRDARDSGEFSPTYALLAMQIVSDVMSADGERSALDKLMTFDVIWKYCRYSYDLGGAWTRLTDEGSENGWERLAENFHADADPTNSESPILPMTKPELVDWAAFRGFFRLVLDETPLETRRTV